MRWLTGILLITIAAPAAAQQVQVTLQQAVQRALQVQPAMVQARGDETNAGAQRLAAIGAFVPSVTLNSSAFRQNLGSFVNGVAVPGSAYQYSTGLNFSVDLFDGLRRGSRYPHPPPPTAAGGARPRQQPEQGGPPTQKTGFKSNPQ